MSKFFKKIFPFLFKTTWNLKPEHEVELAFISGGMKYYKFVNEFKIPYERGVAAADIWAEFDERMDSKDHKSAYKSIIEYARKGDLVEVAKEAEFCLERMDNITNVDLMYKMASVLYFDESENCYGYDYEYNEKKRKLWQKDKDIDSFFLKTALVDYLPSSHGSKINTLEYTQEQRKQILNHLKHRLSILSEGSKKTDLILTLQSQVRELEELLMID